MAKRRGEGFEADDEERGPERTCAVTREKATPEAMLRFVLGPDHQVTPDIKRKLPGRGVWVGLSRQRVAQAVKKQVFSRGLKEKAVAAPDLPELVEDLLRRDALQALSLANKAGLVTTGFVKVEKAIEAGDVGALLHARDGAADGKRKLGQGLRRTYGPEGKPEIGLFSNDEIGAALGRDHVVHAALGNGAATKVLLASCRRLAVYRGDDNADGPAGGDILTADETDAAGDISSWDARTI
ncbi:RNA-binding protein [Rhodoblastus acidophilus]|uniref:RNA-binding protein n=1 Tax=Rhodoblastus acidophilus TaxID=1074 RepID=A0A6N8DQC7_RHOAC|nr:RNA-binding protein [Rhodoblastus acidophilus]MCW2275546.1 putative RNA-binding protein YlxR (DUF448 family) [Rhodoblastus acidophilus]MTV32046.1 RNA-binding protein [Rhodoblastus acidophilus]